jgi:hypothetical protein
MIQKRPSGLVEIHRIKDPVMDPSGTVLLSSSHAAPKAPEIPDLCHRQLPYRTRESNGPVLAHVAEKMSFPAIHDVGNEP